MAAKDTQSKKRKSAPDAQPTAKKARKSEDGVASQKKQAKPAETIVEPVQPASGKVKSTRKKAADTPAEETPVEVKPAKEKKSKKTKSAAASNGGEAPSADTNVEVTEAVEEKPKKKSKKAKEPEADVEEVADAQPKTVKKSKKSKKTDDSDTAVVEGAAKEEIAVEEKKPKKNKKSKKQEAPKIEAPMEDDEDEDADLDDQTAALLAGFDSDRDESDLEKEDEELDENAVPEITKKQRKQLENVRQDAEPGVIFLGRIPHGFFEPQMKKYFSQFGAVTRLRLSRNKKTGASKHYAFIEFANSEVAEIVAKTMHNYLMFGHILQCRIIAPEQVHPELFKGANERFKVDPRNQKAGSAMARGAGREVWEKRVDKENKRRADKTKELQEEFGYDFQAPALKDVDGVPKDKSLENVSSQQLLPAAPDTEVESKSTEPVKSKKSKKNTKVEEPTAKEAEPEADTGADVVPEETVERKAKKGKGKRKSDVVAQAEEEPEVTAPKSKKAKETEGVVPEKKRKAKAASQADAAPKKAKKSKA